MVLSHSAVARVGLPLAIACLALAPAAHAAPVLIDFDSAAMRDFATTPHLENGTTTTVDAGHYEILAYEIPPGVAGGPKSSQALSIDEQQLGLSRITLRADNGAAFDAVSLEVVNPADTAGEYTISAVGGGGGNIPAPTTAGPLAFGPEFAGISALVIQQNSPGMLAIDDVQITVLPEPSATASLVASALAAFALRRRRRAR